MFAVVSGATCGLGNYIMGIHLSRAGIMGAALTGPLNLVILSSYRIVQALNNKSKYGTFINYNDSNWFTKDRSFKRYHLKALGGNFIPNLLGLVLLSLSFKYASIGGLN